MYFISESWRRLVNNNSKIKGALIYCHFVLLGLLYWTTFQRHAFVLNDDVVDVYVKNSQNNTPSSLAIRIELIVLWNSTKGVQPNIFQTTDAVIFAITKQKRLKHKRKKKGSSCRSISKSVIKSVT